MTETHRNVRVRTGPYCRRCGGGLRRGRRPGYCSPACRQGAYRARKRGDPQALFDRWCDLLHVQPRAARTINAVQDLESELYGEHGIDPHEALRRIAEDLAERRSC